MSAFETKTLPSHADDIAPDGSEVRVLLRTDRGSMAHFQLPPGTVSTAAVHLTLDEIWYVLAGKGEMWRRKDDIEEVVPMVAGVCLSIPAGTTFQFRALGSAPLQAVGVTMPPWSGPEDATLVEGIWTPSA